MYEYLIGILIMAVVWALGFILRKDLRKAMIWSGVAYIIVITAWFFVLRFLYILGYIEVSITPDYWSPNTLLNIGKDYRRLCHRRCALYVFCRRYSNICL